MIKAIWIVVAALFAQPLNAQEFKIPNDYDERPDCFDDHLTDRCEADVQAAMRATYKVESAEKLLEQGITSRRAMFVDGYGRDVGMVEFRRLPGQSPEVQFVSPLDEAGDAQPLKAMVSDKTWQMVLGQSEFFDRKLASEVNAEDDDELTICLHSWVVVVEGVDAMRLQPNLMGQKMLDGAIRRDTEDACTGGLAIQYAFLLASIARDNLPECSSLDLDWFRNVPMLLASCHAMRGDRLAGADAYADLEELRREFGEISPEQRWWKFAGSAKQMADPFFEALAGMDLFFGIPEASDADHAVVEGGAFVRGGDVERNAKLKLILVRQADRFVILDYEIDWLPDESAQ